MSLVIWLGTKNNIYKLPISTIEQKIRYLGIVLPSEMQDLYSENFKQSFRKIKEDLNKWEDIHDDGLKT